MQSKQKNWFLGEVDGEGDALGETVMGGRFPSRLPPTWRLLALFQAALLCTTAAAVLAPADDGIAALVPLFWSALALTHLSLVANAASPSGPERLLWTPFLFLIAVAALGVGLS